MQAEPFSTKNNTEQIQTITEGTASGTLLGGNLTVLTAMMGSDYLPLWDNSILFVEGVGEEIYRIDRMLTQLHLAGVFERINGFIFGKCVNCEQEAGPAFTLREIVKQHVKKFNIPTFMGANIGHIDDMVTVPIGATAKMDAGTGMIKLFESPTEA